MEEIKELLKEVLRNQAVIYAKMIEMENKQKGSSATHHYVDDAISKMNQIKREDARSLSSFAASNQ